MTKVKDTDRAIAVGVASIRIATYGDGVPGSDFKALPNPSKESVVFNFADPKEVKIEVEGTDEPLAIIVTKDSTDYVEFAIPSPSNDTVKELKGGTISTGTGDQNIWEEPTTIPSINKTVEITTTPFDGKQVIYTIVNGKIVAKFSQAPSKEKTELLLVRVYKQAAITQAGVAKTAFTREVKIV